MWGQEGGVEGSPQGRRGLSPQTMDQLVPRLAELEARSFPWVCSSVHHSTCNLSATVLQCVPSLLDADNRPTSWLGTAVSIHDPGSHGSGPGRGSVSLHGYTESTPHLSPAPHAVLGFDITLAVWTLAGGCPPRLRIPTALRLSPALVLPLASLQLSSTKWHCCIRRGHSPSP